MNSVESRLRAELDEAREEVRQLRAALASEQTSIAMLCLPRQERAVLAVMMRGGVKSAAVLEDALEADRPSKEGRCSSHVPVIVDHLRKRLRPYGVSIGNRYGQGYSIDDAGRHRVRSLCEAGTRLGAAVRLRTYGEARP